LDAISGKCWVGWWGVDNLRGGDQGVEVEKVYVGPPSARLRSQSRKRKE
jgi:hypothetical protein